MLQVSLALLVWTSGRDLSLQDQILLPITVVVGVVTAIAGYMFVSIQRTCSASAPWLKWHKETEKIF